MDNNLSELSKPVGFVSDLASTQLKEGDRASIRPFFDVQGSSPLYSQEYVSALLAELEAKDKRIAELEAKLSEMTTFRDNALNKTLRYWGELLELRARLATPVRLPTEHELHQVACSECAGNCLELVESTVRAAGFTVEGGE